MPIPTPFYPSLLHTLRNDTITTDMALQDSPEEVVWIWNKGQEDILSGVSDFFRRSSLSTKLIRSPLSTWLGMSPKTIETNKSNLTIKRKKKIRLKIAKKWGRLVASTPVTSTLEIQYYQLFFKGIMAASTLSKRYHQAMSTLT